MPNKPTCDTCGRPCKRSASDLRKSVSGKVFCTRECWASYQRTKQEAATGLPDWARSVFASAKKRAAKKGMVFSLTDHEMKVMVAESKGRCALSGIAFDTQQSDRKNQRRPYFPSMDRIDSTKGYEIGNVRLVCVAINLAMNSWGEDVLFGIAVGVLGDALPLFERKSKYAPRFKNKHLGTFSNRVDAIRAYIEAIRGCDNRAIGSEIERYNQQPK